MKQVITKGKIPIKLWLDDIEPGALEQALHLTELPFAFKHVAIMPDAHQGYGMPIGGVIALDNVIIPNAVGVDIGCGMCAVQTPLTEINTELLKKILSKIRKTIPVGRDHHRGAQKSNFFNIHKLGLFPGIKYNIVAEEFDSSKKQIGTLGGGNHFIEFQKGSDGHIWIMIHSGSRNVGKKVCDYWNGVAKKLNEKWASSIPPSWQLSFLPMNSDEGRNYFEEMNWCVAFALANRNLMMTRILEIIANEVNSTPKDIGIRCINIAHNYAAIENHFGKNVVVHRKGATKAGKDLTGIIPGSQGTKSYIVRGKGNPLSFESCSHGAGRVMSRSRAREVLSLEDEKRKLEEKGILHAIRGISDLDEASGAYKDIDVVMENQNDLVEIIVELTPLAVIKG